MHENVGYEHGLASTCCWAVRKAKIHGDESIRGWLGEDPRLALARLRQHVDKQVEVILLGSCQQFDFAKSNNCWNGGWGQLDA